MAELQNTADFAGYSADRRADALTAGLPVSTFGPGWFGVPSRSGGDGYHVQPERWNGHLILRCSCTSGQTRYAAQLPCVHAGIVCLLLEERGFVEWVESQDSLTLCDSDDAIRAVLSADPDPESDPF